MPACLPAVLTRHPPFPPNARMSPHLTLIDCAQGRRVRTRLYFTSESHLHSLLNVMRFSDEVRWRLHCVNGWMDE